MIRAAFADVWNYKSTLFPIVLTVTAPVVVVSLLTGSDQTLGTYGSFATLIMNLATVSAVIKLMKGQARVSLSEAYYQGTSRLVAFIGAVAILGLQMIPFLIGGVIYLSGSTGATVGLSTVELVLLGGIWLLFSVPTLRWLTRSVFGLYLVQDPQVRPLEAVRASSALVYGRSWVVLGRILAGALLMVVILFIPSLAVSTLPDSASLMTQVATGLLQIVSALVLVPFASVYGYKILEALDGKSRTSRKAS
jgi:hypothetical protein